MSMVAELILKLVDKLSAPAKKAGAVMRGFKKIFGDIGTATARLNKGFGMVADGATRMASSIKRIAVLGTVGAIGALGASLAFLKTQLLPTASQFEKFLTVLETIEGSADKAKSSMAWVSDFAAKTPYELKEVTDSFVKLRAYGMQPMNGLLKSLGDTSAAMGKPLMQAVEAVADAVTGENERLKEFGVRASKVGKDIVYEYSLNGKTMTKKAKANSREQIQAVLEGIFNSKYAGAMDKLSGTWDGMMSNMSDQWERFKLLIMGSGVFDWMKDKLKTVLDTINQMADNGSLKAFAEQIGTHIVEGFNLAVQLGKELIAVGQEIGTALAPIKDMLGGWGGVIKAIIALPFVAIAISMAAGIATILAGITTIGAALIGLGALFLPVTAAIALIAAGAYLIYQNWATIGPMFQRIGADIMAAFSAIGAAIQGDFSQLLPMIAASLNGLTAIVMNPINDLVLQLTGINLHEQGAAVLNTFWEGLKSVGAAIVAWAVGIGQAIANAFKFNISLPSMPSMPKFLGGSGGSKPGTAPTPGAVSAPLRDSSGADVPARANGGPVRKGSVYQINEKGQELFAPGASGQIIPHQRTKSIVSGGGGGGSTSIAATFHIAAADPEAAARAVEQRLNGMLSRALSRSRDVSLEGRPITG